VCEREGVCLSVVSMCELGIKSVCVCVFQARYTHRPQRRERERERLKCVPK